MASEFKGADGVSYRWIDGDTFTDGTQRYRVEGFNAPETDKIRKEKRDTPWYEGIITEKTDPEDVIRFNLDFFSNFPSRRAARAGILSAWIGSSLVLLVTFFVVN